MSAEWEIHKEYLPCFNMSVKTIFLLLLVISTNNYFERESAEILENWQMPHSKVKRVSNVETGLKGEN